MIICCIFLVLGIFMTTASNDLSCPATEACNGSFIAIEESRHLDGSCNLLYRIKNRSNSSGWEKFDYYIFEEESPCSNITTFEGFELSYQNEIDVKKWYYISSLVSKFVKIVVIRSTSKIILDKLVEAKNVSTIILDSCCLYLPGSTQNATEPNNIESIIPSNSTEIQDVEHPYTKCFLVITVVAVISCIVIIGTMCILFYHRKKNPKLGKQPQPGDVPLDLTVTPNQVCEIPQFLFIYVSDNQSFKEVVIFLQRMIESTKTGQVTDPYKEIDNICRDDPLAWLASRISRNNTKVVLFLNAKIMSYYITKTSSVPDDPLSLLLNVFFSQWRSYLRSEQLIHVCMDKICIPKNYKISRLYALPSHFDKLMQDLEVCIEKDTITKEREKLQRYYEKYEEPISLC
ncbi:hypothetical protein FOCC_FOCC001995 [Frankliniella occidentalis]|uniref:Uncharacterized protein LOC113216973 n=1 Tax=Frankliniella occidentalis TaxID=133901 RepID=A0A9C6XWP8_FRAOC|nr:uncharacterized protein LOC113216973 [Frankliniella occidentalis]KAE8751420.1 hypothetical protein FOCC_FOCC001995 [Frankliniella occidentalis]